MFIIIKLSEIYDPADPMRDSGQGSRSFPSERCKSRELEAEIGANERGEQLWKRDQRAPSSSNHLLSI